MAQPVPRAERASPSTSVQRVRVWRSGSPGSPASRVRGVRGTSAAASLRTSDTRDAHRTDTAAHSGMRLQHRRGLAVHYPRRAAVRRGVAAAAARRRAGSPPPLACPWQHHRLQPRPKHVCAELLHREMVGRPRLHRKRVFHKIPSRLRISLSRLLQQSVPARDAAGANAAVSELDPRCCVFLGFCRDGEHLCTFEQPTERNTQHRVALP